jgi:hypothetical protein
MRMQRIWVGTRKGLFRLDRQGDGWGIGRADFLGVPVTMLLPDGDELFVALAHGHFGVKLHCSRDGGEHWEERATPAFPVEDKGASLELIWALESGADGALWAGAIPAGLFRSRDRGASWDLVRPLWDRPERAEWLGGGYDHPGIHSICVDPRDRRRLTLGISCGGVWRSDDDGASFELRATGMRATFMPPERAFDPNIQDPHRVVQCAARPDVLWAQHHNGIFRSVDGGASWSEISDVAPSTFGFAVAVHPQDPDTAWFLPARADSCRVPVDGRLVMTRTRDGGRSFETLRAGLPDEPAYDLVYRHGLDVAADGARLAFGSTSGGLWTSDDGGGRFRPLGARLPPIACVRFG